MNSAVAVVGLGKLGGPLAALLAARGHLVFGVDQDDATIKDLLSEKEHWEPRLAATLKAVRGRLVLSTDYEEAISRTSLACIVVPTPSDAEQPRFSLKHVLAAVERIVQIVAAARLPEYTIDLVSTVMPGDCQKTIWPLIERERWTRPSRVHLVYSPQFIALGDVIRGLEEPDFLLVGGRDRSANARVAQLHASLTVSEVPVVETGLINAELAKLAINCLLGVKVSWANLFAAACEQLPGSDIDEVTRVIGHDSRIGRKYLKGGLGFGGPCLPRDLRALADMVKTLVPGCTLPDSIIQWNDEQAGRVAAVISARLPAGKTLVMLGITYREGTAVTEASQPLAIATTLLRQGYEVVVYDPAVSHKTCAEWGFDVAANLAECIERADGVVLAQCGELWRLVPEAVWLSRRPIVVDCWRQLPRSFVEKLAGNYLALGRPLPMPNVVRPDPSAIRFDPLEIPGAASHRPRAGAR